MMIHPGNRALSDFADDASDARIRAHLAKCTACRETVQTMRSLDNAAKAAADAAPCMSAQTLDAILKRVDSGEVVLLPTDETTRSTPARGRDTKRRLTGIAAAVAAIAAIGILVTNTRTLEAEASSLRFLPVAPHAGAKVGVEYHATSRLANESVIQLRARVRRPGNGPRGEMMVLGRLKRTADRTFKGAFTLPEGAVYVVVAVEDTLGNSVDAGGEQWDVLVHGSDGKPVADALVQKIHDAQMRNTEISNATTDLLSKLHPNNPETWNLSYLRAIDNASRAVRDSITNARVAMLPSQLASVDTTTEDAISSIAFYAKYIGATDISNQFHERLVQRFPKNWEARRHLYTKAMNDAGEDRDKLWANLEERWNSGHENQDEMIFNAFRTAQLWKDDAAIKRWGERMIEQHMLDKSMIIPAYMTSPALRSQGMNYIREYVRELENRPDKFRGLSQTRADFKVKTSQAVGFYLAQLGRALADDGKYAAANDTLTRAADVTWDVDVFRSVAKTKLALGDTAGAMPVFARIAADPLTSPSFADSIAAAFPRAYNAAQWANYTSAGVAFLKSQLMLNATTRPARGDFHLTDGTGKSSVFAGNAPTETFVAVWSRHCPPSLMQLGQVQKLAQRMSSEGVRIITIADEDARDGGVVDFMKQQKLTFPYYFDPDREARRALDIEGTPTYLLLDKQGRVRFESHDTGDILRQLWYLRQGRVALK